MGAGNKLKELLKKKNITVADLSRKTKISAQTLYSIINRDSNLSYENLFLIAKILDVDYMELIDIENDTDAWRDKKERDKDDLERYGHIAEHTFESSMNYLFDHTAKFEAYLLNMYMKKFNYEILYEKGLFLLSNGKNKTAITRDDIEYVNTKCREYIKNLLDSITNNELISDDKKEEE